MKVDKAHKAIYFTPTSQISRNRLYRAIRTLGAGVYAVDLTLQRNKASTAQRGYYWGYLVPEVAKFLKRDRESTDKILCALFLTDTWQVYGAEVSVTLSTADLSTAQTEEYYSKIRVYAYNTWRLDLKEPNGVSW